MTEFTDFAAIPRGRYSAIMADPPWRFAVYSDKGRGKSAEQHYRTMTLSDIKALPVAEIAAPDCMLWLWATAPMFRHALEVIDAWGFTYKTQGVWVKTTQAGRPAFGTGYLLRSSHEPFIIATRGKPEIVSRSTRSVITAQRRAHSQKPEAARSAFERMTKAERIELFARSVAPSWDAFGDQIGILEDCHDIATSG
jgi:N6-adenosine-specific RNA methylase IME4